MFQRREVLRADDGQPESLAVAIVAAFLPTLARAADVVLRV